MLVTERWNATYCTLLEYLHEARGTPSCRQRACVTDTCAATLDEALPTLTGWDLTGWQTLGFVGVHSSAPVNALIEAPAFCIFVRKQPHRRSKHGVGRADHSGQP